MHVQEMGFTPTDSQQQMHEPYHLLRPSTGAEMATEARGIEIATALKPPVLNW